MMSIGCHYPTDVSHTQWDILSLPLPRWHPGGPGRKPVDLRRVSNGLFSVNKAGGQGRMMPTEIGVCLQEGPAKGALEWQRPNRMTLQNTLKHPCYAGPYV